ncbi:hypothetical protein LCGC14_1306900 [marine sediment metagenome]|uniref:Uncharacterized protein n=1 Tax=marine sediment metagenome TaxID=412755 RepID=A0A0F9KNZ9_9ZZZZ
MIYHLKAMEDEDFQLEVEGDALHSTTFGCPIRYISPRLDGSITVAFETTPGRVDREAYPSKKPKQGTLWVQSRQDLKVFTTPYRSSSKNTSETIWTAPPLVIKATIGEPQPANSFKED